MNWTFSLICWALTRTLLYNTVLHESSSSSSNHLNGWGGIKNAIMSMKSDLKTINKNAIVYCKMLILEWMLSYMLILIIAVKGEVWNTMSWKVNMIFGQTADLWSTYTKTLAIFPQHWIKSPLIPGVSTKYLYVPSSRTSNYRRLVSEDFCGTIDIFLYKTRV